jgi:hypothetical protein
MDTEPSISLGKTYEVWIKPFDTVSFALFIKHNTKMEHTFHKSYVSTPLDKTLQRVDYLIDIILISL